VCVPTIRPGDDQGQGRPQTFTPLGQVVGLHWLKAQPAPVHRQCEPPLQLTVQETAALQSTSHVDLPEQLTVTVRPAWTATAQVLPPPQLAMHVLPASQVKPQVQVLVEHARLQASPKEHLSTQHGLQLVAQPRRHELATSPTSGEARSCAIDASP